MSWRASRRSAPAPTSRRASASRSSACIGDREEITQLPLEAMPGVDRVVAILKPYKLVSREFQQRDTVIEVRGAKIGGGHFAVIAGPCSVETPEQVLEAARAVKAAGGLMMRGGAFKPRTLAVRLPGAGRGRPQDDGRGARRHGSADRHRGDGPARP